VTQNSPGGPNTGPNALQNYPVLSSAETGASGTTIQGTLNSDANTPFRIEFFANPTADPSGYGQGQTYLGFAMVATDDSGTRPSRPHYRREVSTARRSQQPPPTRAAIPRSSRTT